LKGGSEKTMNNVFVQTPVLAKHLQRVSFELMFEGRSNEARANTVQTRTSI
jgi:hypothetical protein